MHTGTLHRLFPSAKLDEPLRRYTAWKIGGPADALLEPTDTEELIAAVQKARKNNIPVTVLGGGTNVLVRDGGIRGLTIRLAKSLTNVEIDDLRVTADAGVLYPVLANTTAARGLAGLEFATGIPGTVGGAVYMNAGAYGSETVEVLDWADVYRDGQVVRMKNVRETPHVKTPHVKTPHVKTPHVKTLHATSPPPDATSPPPDATSPQDLASPQDPTSLGLSYRRSVLHEHPDWIVLRARYTLEPGDPENLKARIKEFRAQRMNGSPNRPSCGSTFKRPPGDFPGRVIEAAGLKGTRVGNIEVSPVHANYLVNLGGGTAEEALELIELVRTTVRDKMGIDLETEVRVVGEP